MEKQEDGNDKLFVDCCYCDYLFVYQEKATNSGGCVANTKPKKTKQGDIGYERTCKAIYR